VFGFHKWELAKGCISGPRRLDFIHLRQLAKGKFYLKTESISSVIHDVFWTYLRYNSLKDRLCTRIVKTRDAVMADFNVQ